MKTFFFLILLTSSVFAQTYESERDGSIENKTYSSALSKACNSEITAWANYNFNFDDQTTDEDLDKIDALEKQMNSCMEAFNQAYKAKNTSNK